MARSSPWSWLPWLALALVAGSGARGAPQGPGPWRYVWPEQTGLVPRAEWDAARHALALATFAALGFGEATRTLARAAVAHWIHETGRRNEWNHNVGNAQGNVAWRGAVADVPHVSHHHRAYPSLADGVADYVRIVTSVPAYAVHTAALAGGTIDEAEWWRRLLRSGYAEHVPTDTDMTEHRSIVAQLAREFPG